MSMPEEENPLDMFEDHYDDDVDLSPQNRAPSSRVERFKGEQGKIYRVALLHFHPLEVSIIRRMKALAKKEKKDLDVESVKDTIKKALEKRAEALGKPVEDLEDWQKLDTSRAQFKKFQAHYQDGIGSITSRLGKDGPEADKIWGQLDDAKQYYSTVVMVYPTDAQGNVDKDALARSTVVKPWRVGPRMFNTLIAKDAVIKQYGAKASLATSDLTLECTNGQYQNFDIEPAGEALWTKSTKLKEKFLPLACKLYDKLIDSRDITTPELKEKLGIADEGSDDISDDDDMDLLADV